MKPYRPLVIQMNTIINNFNTYYDGDEERSFTRVIKTTVDLRELTLTKWTDEELHYRLAVIYPKIDGYGYSTASQEVRDEFESLRAELQRRNYDWSWNLRQQERFSGWGWVPWFRKLDGTIIDMVHDRNLDKLDVHDKLDQIEGD